MNWFFKLRIFDAPPKDWQDLEQLVRQSFAEMGYCIPETKQVPTVRGPVDIDVVAVNQKTPIPTKILVECKFWERKVPQSVIHGFRSVCADIGAHAGLVISKAGFQAGANQKCEFTNIQLLTFDEFQETYFQEWKSGSFVNLCRMRDEILPLFRSKARMHPYGTEIIETMIVADIDLEEKYWMLRNSAVNDYFVNAAEFPKEFPDPRGDPSVIETVNIESHRHFFDICWQATKDAKIYFNLPDRHFISTAGASLPHPRLSPSSP